MSLEKLGVSRFDLRDPYHFALTLSWPEFFVVLALAYLGLNLVFALLYVAAPGSIDNLPPHSLLEAFFFSVETLATVGYGHMSPATLYGHAVATLEIFVGMIFTATMTGVVFVRFSKPKAKILFADRPVVSRQGRSPALMVRVGNGRMNSLTDAVARLSLVLVDVGPDGQRMRRVVQLKLVQPEYPFFPLTWTLIHTLDADSPLHGLTPERAEALSLRLMLSITARDPSLGAEVHAVQGYASTDIVFGMRYVDAVTWDGGNSSVADMRMISAVEPEPGSA